VVLLRAIREVMACTTMGAYAGLQVAIYFTKNETPSETVVGIRRLAGVNDIADGGSNWPQGAN